MFTNVTEGLTMAKLTFEQFQKKVSRFARENPKIVGDALVAGAEMVRAQSVEHHLSGPTTPTSLSAPSGTLRTSLTTQAKVGPGRQSAVVKTNVKYAAIHEYGGTIRAKEGGYLHFKGSRGWARVKSVTMPERRFLRGALDEKRRDVLDLILRLIVAAFRRGGGPSAPAVRR